MPPRWLPLLYFALAHLSLAAALLACALRPQALAGFYYHPRLLAVVHLVTLGWIAGSILGAIHVVGPLALRAPLPARRLDFAAFALFAAGLAAMAAHFWIDEPLGMAWGAGMAAVTVAHVSARAIRAVARAPVPAEVRLHLVLAFANAIGAAAAGVLLGANKLRPFLPGFVLSNVAAHAHLAAVGFAVMAFMGSAYRLLPMMLPAAMPRGPFVWAGAVLVTLGVWGLFVGLVAGAPVTGVCAVAIVAGLAAFASRVAWMLRHRRPPPSEMPRPDLATVHAFLAMAYLIAAAALGLVLAFAPASETTLRLTLLYGVTGLVGFLAQVVVGVQARIVPLFAWLWGFADASYERLPPPVHGLIDRRAQAAVLLLWAAGVPLLAAGFWADAPARIASGGWTLLAAVTLGGVANVLALRRAWDTRRFREPPAAAARTRPAPERVE
jgi:hypothetical protein